MKVDTQVPERSTESPSSIQAKDSPAQEYQYDAFISYSTRTDYNKARKVEAFLESFHRTQTPDGVTLRRLQICRDGSDFTLPVRRGTVTLEQDDPVWGIIGSELTKSRYLLVLCSPGAVGSAWVPKEIGWFLEHRGAEWILPVVTEAADPGANPAECFPTVMIEAGLHKKIFYDLRALGQPAGASKVRNYEDELVRLASDLLEWRADKYGPLATIWEREQLKRRRRQATIAIVVAAVVAAVAVIAVWQALAATRQARRARANAIVQTADASFDPLTAALLLAELPREEEPEGGMRVAERLASTPLPRAVLRGHTGSVKKVAFAPDQRHVLTASSDGTTRIWSADGQGDPVILGQRGQPVLDAAFSPDGSLLATGSEDKKARVWRVDGAEAVKEFAHANKVESVQFTFDGQWLLTAAGGKAALWRVEGSKSVLVTLPDDRVVKRLWLSDKSLDGWAAAEDGSVWAFALDAQGTVTVKPGPPKPPDLGILDNVAFSPEGARVALSSDKEVVVERLDGDSSPITLKHEDKITSVCFNRDGSYAATSSSDGKLRVWATADGKLANVFDPKVHFWVIDLYGKPSEDSAETSLGASKALFSHDGSRIMTLSDDGVVRIWDAENKTQPLELRGHLGAEFAAFNGDDTQLVIGSDDGTARVWSLSPPAEPLVLSHSKPVYEASFSRDGRKVLTTSGDGVAHVWEVDTGKSVELDAHSGDIRGAVFNRDATLVAAAYKDGSLRLWSVSRAEGPSVIREFGRSEKALGGVQFSPDEGRLLTWSEDGTVGLWPVDGAGNPSMLESPAGNIWDAEFSPDGSRVLATYEDGTARVWGTDGSGKVVLLGGPEGHSQTVFSGAFSPDGTRVLTVSKDGTARIWHSDGSGHPLVLNGAAPGQDWLEQCTYSPTGETVVTTSSAGRVWIWRTDGQGRPIVLRYINDLAHNGPVTSVTFSPDGRYLVTSGGVDAAVRVWQADGSGRPFNLVGHGGTITKASFSADGARVLSASEDGTARIWRTRWPDLITHLRGVTTATLTVEQRMTLLGETEQDAREAYEAAEKEMARTPLPADWRFDYQGF
jgi:WD40 repeat protein